MKQLIKIVRIGAVVQELIIFKCFVATCFGKSAILENFSEPPREQQDPKEFSLPIGGETGQSARGDAPSAPPIG